MKTMLDVFLQNKLCMLLSEIKELNIKKIDRDINLINTSTDYEDIFNTKPKEIEEELLGKIDELNTLVMIAKKGIEHFIENELPKGKKFLNEEEYKELLERFEVFSTLATIPYEEGTEVAN